MKKGLSTEGLILDKNTSGESHWRYTLFSPQHGRILCLQRKSRKPKQQTTIDLFDIGQFQLELPDQGTATFIKDFQLIHRFSQLGKSYSALTRASEFAHIVSNNLQHAEHFTTLYQLCQRTLSALEEAHHPTATLIKSLYLFARDEGYPIKEDWYTHLPTDEQKCAALIINTPLAKLDLNESLAQTILKQLQTWLKTHTDILIH